MNTLFDLPAVDITYAKYLAAFRAAGGNLILNDEQWLRVHMASGRSAKDTAQLTRCILGHNFDEFVKNLLEGRR